MRFLYSFFVMIMLASCGSSAEDETADVPANRAVAATSFLGKPLYAPTLSPEKQQKLEADLKAAMELHERFPDSLEFIIWHGRRLAYLSRYKEAIEVYTKGLTKFPDSYRLRRHRGHRYISIRKLDQAIKDLSEAGKLANKLPVEIEPDGIPNKLNQPLSNTHFNIWYHLGLAYFLKGEFKRAEYAYTVCNIYSVNDDLRCATGDWLYMTLRRQGRHEDAIIALDFMHTNMNIIENDSYFKRLQMYQGDIAPEELLEVTDPEADKAVSMATQGYGVGNWYLCEGDTTKALEVFKEVLTGSHWAAFGYIAAEADLKRLRNE